MESKRVSKALEVTEFGGKTFNFKETELPNLKENEVLIQVKYVPLIHYDLMKLTGVTGATLPYTPCVECSGVIEDASNKSLIGKKASFLSLKVGVLQDRIIATEDEVLILNDDADLQIGSQMSCNPFTALGIVDMAQNLKQKAFALTAANSSVGKIINRICLKEGLNCISIVRSEERKAEMEKEGFKLVVNSSDKNFVQNLNKIMIDNEAQVIFDTLAGPIVGQLMKALPKNGILVNFGTQTHEPYSGIDATDMRWGNKEMKNFLVGPWIDEKIIKGQFNDYKKYISNNQDVFKADVGKIFSWTKMNEAVEYANKSDSNVKTILEITD